MAPALEFLVADQPQICFVDQRGGIERLSGRLRGHLRRGEFPQFVIHEGQQIRGGLNVAFLRRFKHEG